MEVIDSLEIGRMLPPSMQREVASIHEFVNSMPLQLDQDGNWTRQIDSVIKRKK